MTDQSPGEEIGCGAMVLIVVALLILVGIIQAATGDELCDDSYEKYMKHCAGQTLIEEIKGD